MPEGLTPLPCPFCGGTEVRLAEGSTFRWRELSCNACGATCGETRVQTMGTGTPDEWEKQVAQDAIRDWNRRAQPEPAAPADVGPMTERLLDDLKSALNLMLTFFGMDEDENSEEVFDTARQAYNFAAIVSRPIEPHEREALSMLRSTVHQWHKVAVEKGFDGVASMLEQADAAPSVAPEPDDLPDQLDTIIESCSEAAWAMRNAPEPLDPSITYDPFKELVRMAYAMGYDQGAHPDDYPPRAPLTRELIEECRNALAEELAAWDIDPPLHHVKQAHDKCMAWLADKEQT